MKHRIHTASVLTRRGWDELRASWMVAGERLDARRSTEQLDETIRRLSPKHADVAPEVVALRQAILDRDVPAYEHGLAALRVARAEQEQQKRCDLLLDRLRQVHPLLAERLVRTADAAEWDDRLHRLADAWAWARAVNYCEEQRSPGRDQELQNALDEAEHRLTMVTERLATEHAWLHCLNRMTQEQRQALQSYRSHMGSLGKGTSLKYASRYRRAARDAMDMAQGAVPAWIMPLPQVVETIRPNPDSFDVVIVDEASQVGLEGLLLLWLAPRVIVVGDDKQCAPGFTTVEYQRLFDRLDLYLPDMREAFRNDFKPRTNLYELLSSRFPKVIRLTEHFRCMPEIIGWSSRQFYAGTLVPLRQFGAARLEPLCVEYVEGGYTEGRDQQIRNPIEAKRIVDKLLELLADPAYGGRSFGVIALQGEGQARLIDGMIASSIDPVVREKHQIRVGTPPEFQGDERDVMLLSMVVTEPRRILGGRLDEQRRWNVAASRARDQMWLFTSLTRDRLKKDDLRHSLLSYMLDPPSPFGDIPELSDVRDDARRPPFDSLFEQRVYLRLRERGYRVIPQFEVNGKRIDLVVVGAAGRLAVECDGHAFHTLLDQVRDDMERERELRRAGWTFWRVRDSEFSFDPDQALESLWPELERSGVEPGIVLAADGEPAGTWEPLDLPISEDEPGTPTA